MTKPSTTLKAGRPTAARPAKTLADVTSTEMTRLNAEVSRDLLKRLKIEAAQTEMTLSAIVREALERHLAAGK